MPISENFRIRQLKKTYQGWALHIPRLPNSFNQEQVQGRERSVSPTRTVGSVLLGGRACVCMENQSKLYALEVTLKMTEVFIFIIERRPMRREMMETKAWTYAVGLFHSRKGSK